MDVQKRVLPGELKELRILGRTGKNNNPLVLFWTGSGFECNYEGSELWCEFETDYSCYEQWIAVFINGALISRQMLQKGKQQVCLFRNMQMRKVTHVKVVKEVQAMPGDEEAYLAVNALYGDGIFRELPEPECRLEFIGDSITSGEGSYGSVEEQDWISMWFSTTQAYPYLVANRMNAEYRVISQSGYGVCCAWDNNPYNTIPRYYTQLCGVLSGARNKALGVKEPYDFSSWQPDYIIINLGTNDGCAFEQPAWKDGTTGQTKKMYKDALGIPAKECMDEIRTAVKEFLRLVRKNNPDAQILWAYGLMGTIAEPAIKDGIAEYQTESGDKMVQYLALAEMKPEHIGARSHPGAAGHAAAAETICRKLCEWKGREK